MKSSLALVIAALTLAAGVLPGCSSSDAKPDQVMGTLAEADKAYWLTDITKAHRWIENAVAVLPDDPDTYFNDRSLLGAVQVTVKHGDYAETVKILEPARKNKSLAGKIISIDDNLCV